MIDVRAHKAVQDAVKCGDLPNIKTCICVECGKPACDYHHFAGYEKKHWLSVEPLCRSCHCNKPKAARRKAELVKWVSFVLTKHDLLLLKRIANIDGSAGMSSTIRRLIRNEADRRGIKVAAEEPTEAVAVNEALAGKYSE